MLLVPVFAAFSKKAGVDLSEQGQLIADALVTIGVAIYVAFSNWKEVQKHRTTSLTTPQPPPPPAPAPGVSL